MWTLAYPWVLFLLAVPWFLRRFLPAHQETRPAVRIPFLGRLATLTGQSPQASFALKKKTFPQQLVLGTAFLLLTLAMSRPQRIELPVTKTIPLRDLMLAVDLSGSMETKDFTNAEGRKIDRLTAVKGVLANFLKERPDDRIGLIFFGSSPFLQCPFTEDHVACDELLNEAKVRMCGPKTALGDAIGLSMQSFARSTTRDKVLILLTDGNDTASQVPPGKAAEIARDQHVTIYCIGVGDPRAAGEEKFDEATLRDIARTTGGDYFHAETRTELAGIYDKLDQLEPVQVETISYQPQKDLFFLPLAAMLLLTFSDQLWRWLRTFRSIHVLSPPVLQTAATVTGFLLMVVLAQAMQALQFSRFHWLRPWTLLALIPAGLLIWGIRSRSDSLRNWKRIISPHLLNHLVVGQQRKRGIRPLTLLGIIWGVGTLAVAGPTWRQEPSPFTQDQSALVICLECTPTMLEKDIQPSRLARAVEKIHDLLAARRGARAALIAYAGSSHVVMPLTADAGAIDYFAGALAPEILPEEGNQPGHALNLARQLLNRSGQPGSILLIAESFPQSPDHPLKALAGGYPVNIYGIGKERSAATSTESPLAVPLNVAELKRVATMLGGRLTLVTPDETDLHQLVARMKTSWIPLGNTESQIRWAEAGYWFTPFLWLLSLLWFCPGWRIDHG